MQKIFITNNRAVIEHLAAEDFRECFFECLHDPLVGMPENHERDAIRLHRENALILVESETLNAIDAYGIDKATEIYSEKWDELLKGWEYK